MHRSCPSRLLLARWCHACFRRWAWVAQQLDEVKKRRLIASVGRPLSQAVLAETHGAEFFGGKSCALCLFRRRRWT